MKFIKYLCFLFLLIFSNYSFVCAEQSKIIENIIQKYGSQDNKDRENKYFLEKKQKNNKKNLRKNSSVYKFNLE